jgi:hypothetical protein
LIGTITVITTTTATNDATVAVVIVPSTPTVGIAAGTIVTGYITPLAATVVFAVICTITILLLGAIAT